MKSLSCFVIVLVLALVMAGCASAPPAVPLPSANQAPAGPGQKFTAYNIWIVPAHNMKCINYKHGHNILPAGTRVHKVRTGEEQRPIQEFIAFQTVDDNRDYKIYFEPSWHPGKKVEDFAKLMFTAKPFGELTQGLTEREINAIRSGQIVDGMSKNAVLVAYGYPPEHRTPSLEAPVWHYWSNKLTSFRVCFDENQKTVLCR